MIRLSGYFMAAAMALFMFLCPSVAQASCPARGTSTAQMVARDNCLEAEISALQATVATLVATSAELQAQSVPGLSDYVRVDTATAAVTFTAANLYIQSGSGATDGQVNGLGNLIVGYGEDGADWGFPTDTSGSHNLVVGFWNSYPSYGGLIAGWANTVSGPFAVAVGGFDNEASGNDATICGGESNVASGVAATVAGGYSGVASSDYTFVGGGQGGSATDIESVVIGGAGGTANAVGATAIGGFMLTGSGRYSTACGGNQVEISTEYGYGP